MEPQFDGNTYLNLSGSGVDVLSEIAWQIAGWRWGLHSGEQLLDAAALRIKRLLQHRDGDIGIGFARGERR